MVSSPFLSSLIRCRLHCKKRQSRVYTEIASPSQAFEADLARSFQELLTQAGDSTASYLSMSCLSGAVGMLLSTQARVQGLVPCLQTPLSVQDMKLIRRYMDDNVKLLDVCKVLRDVMGGVESYVKAIQLALGYLRSKQGFRSERGAMLQARNALISADRHVREAAAAHVRSRRPHDRQLAACSSTLGRMGDKLMAPAADEHSQEDVTCSTSALPAALYGGEMATLFVFKLLAAALGPSSCRSQSQSSPLHVLGRPLWAAPLLTLQDKVNKELLRERVHKKKAQNRSSIIMPDLHIVDVSLQQINEMLRQILEQPSTAPDAHQRDELSRLVDTTSTSADELQTSMATLQHQIEGLFKSLVDTQMALLTRTGSHLL